MCHRPGIWAIAVLAHCAAWLPALVGRAAPLRYAPQAKSQFGYQIKIVADWGEEQETFQGVAVYEVVSADAARFEVRQSGKLAATTTGVNPPFPISSAPSGFGRRTIAYDRQGKLLETYPLTALPYMLGEFETVVFEEFPADERRTWNSQHEVVIAEGSPLGRGATFAGARRGAIENSEYAVASATADSCQITKKYSMQTDEAAATNVANVSMTGNGRLEFDIRRGLFSSITMTYRLNVRANNTTEAATIQLTCRLLAPAELASELQRRDDIQMQAEVRANPNLAGLDKRQRLIAKLKSTNIDELFNVLDQLAETPADDRAQELAIALAPLLKHPDEDIQQLAAKALVVWGTRHVEEEVEAASQSDDFWVKKLAGEALAKIRQQPPLKESEVAAKPAAAPPVKPAVARTWRDASGKFEIQATLVDFDEQSVTLRRDDGREISVPVDKLSRADQEFLKQQSP